MKKVSLTEYISAVAVDTVAKGYGSQSDQLHIQEWLFRK